MLLKSNAAKINYVIYIFICLIGNQSVNSQQITSITIKTPTIYTATATLVEEDVHFLPNLGVGLSEVSLDVVSVINFSEKTSETILLKLTEPKIFRLRYSGTGLNRTWILFIQPGDSLAASVSVDNSLQFSGTNAAYQDFLKTYFMENQYQYLPILGYKPSQIDNTLVTAQVDSLKELRIKAFVDFKNKNAETALAFEAYVMATTHTEPLVIQRLIREKMMRRNRAKKLDTDQLTELEGYILSDFKLMGDDALLSEAYRNELKNWSLIPSTRKFPLSEESRYEISPEALNDVFQFTKDNFAKTPKQLEYLLTYWLNYANTAVETLEPGKSLLETYRKVLPGSPYSEYVDQLVKTRENLVPGAYLPAISLLTSEDKPLSLSELKGKPLVLVFAYTVGQHEPSLKAMEEKYGGKVNFAYASVMPGISVSILNQHTTARKGVYHLWASDENIALLEKELAISIRYPFLVLDGEGKIVNRWIPQEFPDNQPLDLAINKAISTQ